MGRQEVTDDGPSDVDRAGTRAGAGVDRVYVAYLALQAGAGIALWVLLATSDLVRSGFELSADQPAVTDAFVFADLGLAVVGSVVGAWGIEIGARWAVPAVWFTVGTILYPTCYLVIWVALVGTGSVALAVMVPAATLTTWVGVQVYRGRVRVPAPEVRSRSASAG